MTQNVTLLIIDPQNDFCKPPVMKFDPSVGKEIPTGGGALYVPGSEVDIAKLTGFISREKDNIDNIVVTLDTHNQVDIAHPIWWSDEEGNHPDPFTIITLDDIMIEEKWKTTIPQFEEASISYVKALEENGKYPLCIWPPHCLEGTEGHALPEILNNSLREWEKRFAKVNFVRKGMNMWTEHYSAIKAEIPDPTDPRTKVNRVLVDDLKHNSDLIIVAGEASTHCVANTLRDLIAEFNDPVKNTRIVYLKDCCSPVPGFEELEVEFLEELDHAGVQITDSIKISNLF